jgi:uncharacterized protein
MGNPFHYGELAVQERAGVSAKAEVDSRFIRDFMPDQHREFFPQLPFLLIGGVDELAQPWASILEGNLGFISSPDPKSLRIDANCLFGTPFTLEPQKSIGILGIELPTRRRNRLNGIISNGDRFGFSVEVIQSFGNCHKYIQKRDYHFITDAQLPIVRQSQHLEESDRALIRNADTFFIASANLDEDGSIESVDVSHRGGNVGFVAIDGDRLTVPDFSGNNFFNTLGNLQNYPKAGLLFIDFASGDLLYVAVTSEVIWEGEEVRSFTGAQRLVRFCVQNVRRVSGSLRLRWDAPEFSPHLKATGIWSA